MEHTMDNNHLNEGMSSTQQYYCQQAYNSSMLNTAPSQIRDGQRYDPVRESMGWDHSNLNSSSRPAYNTHSSPQQWLPSPYSEIQGQSYRAYPPEVLHTSAQSQDIFSTRPSRTPLDMQWNQSDGFNAYASQAQIDHETSEITASSSAHQLSSTVTAMTTTSLRGLEAVSSTPPLTSTVQVQQIAHELDQRSQITSHQHSTSQVRGTASTGWDQSDSGSVGTQTYRQIGSPYLQNRNQDFDDESDEDEDESDINTYVSIQSSQARFLLGPDGLEGERSIAAIRGALAACKRITSKEALASLEPVLIERLNKNESTCIICYNQFGVKNPEGIIEFPLRLPKCKHIFGDKCIRKWFEGSDSCPYCRDKLPSEPLLKRSLGQASSRARQDQASAWSLRARVSNTRLRNHSPESGEIGRSNLTSSVGHDSEHTISTDTSSESAPINRLAILESLERRRQLRTRIASSRFIQEPYRQNYARLMAASNQIPPHQGTSHEGSLLLENTLPSHLSGVPANTAITTENGVSSTTQVLPLPYWLSVGRTSTSQVPNYTASGYSAEATLARFENLNEVQNRMQRSFADTSNYFSDLGPNQIFLSMAQSQAHLSHSNSQPDSNTSRYFSIPNSFHRQAESIRETDIGHRLEADFHTSELSPRWST